MDLNINVNNSSSAPKTNKTQDTLSKLGSVLAGVGTVGATAYKTVGDIQDPKTWIDRGYSYMMRPQMYGDTYQNIKTDYLGYRPLTYVNKKNMGYSTTNALFNTLQASGAGASAGSAFGGWGALAGGIIGGLAGGLGWIFGNKKADRAVRKVNNAYRDINDYNARMFPLRYMNTRNEEEQQLAYNAYSNRGLGYARGGLISDLNSGILSPFGNRFDKGGYVDSLLHTNGSDWSNGFVYIGAGGSHESNPNGGTQVSTDGQGTPNLLEEGEVMYNSKTNGTWAFSKRTKIPKEDKKALGIKGGKNMTYADAMIQRQKVAGEMPYDPIEQRGMEDFAMKLAQSQENTKQQENLEQMLAQYQMEQQLGQEAYQLSKGGKVKKKKGDSNKSLADLMLLNAIRQDRQDYENQILNMHYANPYMPLSTPTFGLGYNGFANGGLVNIFDRGDRVMSPRDPAFLNWMYNDLQQDQWEQLLNERVPYKAILSGNGPGLNWRTGSVPSIENIYSMYQQDPNNILLRSILMDIYNKSVYGEDFPSSSASQYQYTQAYDNVPAAVPVPVTSQQSVQQVPVADNNYAVPPQNEDFAKARQYMSDMDDDQKLAFLESLIDSENGIFKPGDVDMDINAPDRNDIWSFNSLMDLLDYTDFSDDELATANNLTQSIFDFIGNDIEQQDEQQPAGQSGNDNEQTRLLNAATYKYLADLNPQQRLDLFNWLKDNGLVVDSENVEILNFIAENPEFAYSINTANNIEDAISQYQDYLNNQGGQSNQGSTPDPNTPSRFKNQYANQYGDYYDYLSNLNEEGQKYFIEDLRNTEGITVADDITFQEFLDAFNNTDVSQEYFQGLKNFMDEHYGVGNMDIVIPLEREPENEFREPEHKRENVNLGRSTTQYDSKGKPIWPPYVQNGLVHANAPRELEKVFVPGNQEYLDYYFNRIRNEAIAKYKEEHPDDPKLEHFVDPTAEWKVFNPTYDVPGDAGFFYEKNNLSAEQYAQNWDEWVKNGNYTYGVTPLGSPQNGGRFINPETGEEVSEQNIPAGIDHRDWWVPYTIKDVVTDKVTGELHWDMLPAQQVLQTAYRNHPERFEFYPKDPTEPEKPAEMPGYGLSPLRYFPAFAGIFPVMSDLLGESNVPEYRGGNALRNQIPLLNVPPYQPQQDYISTDPFARDYYLNQYLADANAVRRGLLGNVGGNRAAATQQLQTADMNTLNKIGELQRAGQEYNRKDYLTTREYNRNSKNTDTDNAFKYAQLMHESKKAQQESLAKAIALDEQELATVSQNRSTNWDNFVNNIGALGEDAHNYRMFKMLENAGYFGTTLEQAARNYDIDIQDYLDWKTNGRFRWNNNGIYMIPLNNLNSNARGGRVKSRKRKHLTY